MIPRTPKQQRCLNAIADLTAKGEGVPPSLHELAIYLGYHNRSGIHHVLCDLKDRGLITWEPGKARTIQLIADPPDLPPDVLQLIEDAEIALRQATNRYQSIAEHREGRAPLPQVAQAHAQAEKVLCRIASLKGRLFGR